MEIVGYVSIVIWAGTAHLMIWYLWNRARQQDAETAELEELPDVLVDLIEGNEEDQEETPQAKAFREINSDLVVSLDGRVRKLEAQMRNLARKE